MVAELKVREELLAPNGYLHAATVVALADTMCGYGCIALARRRQGFHHHRTQEQSPGHGAGRHHLGRSAAAAPLAAPRRCGMRRSATAKPARRSRCSAARKWCCGRPPRKHRKPTRRASVDQQITYRGRAAAVRRRRCAPLFAASHARPESAHLRLGAHEQYLKRFGEGRKRVVFLGMNPGPFGMVQVGVPFGEVNAVRDWMQISAPVAPPKTPNPSRPVEGFTCQRSEVRVSACGRFFAERYPHAQDFCRPLCAELLPAGVLRSRAQRDTRQAPEERNRTALCRLRCTFRRASTRWRRNGWSASASLPDAGASSACPFVPAGEDRHRAHPSPAGPIANRGWAPQAAAQLTALGIW